MYKTYTYDDPEQQPSLYEELEENEVFTPGYDEGVFKQVGNKKNANKKNQTKEELTENVIDPIQEKHPFYKPYKDEENKPLIFKPISQKNIFEFNIEKYYDSIRKNISKPEKTKHSGSKHEMTRANADAWPVKEWKGSDWNVDHGWFGEERSYYPPGITHQGVDINSNLGGNSDLGAPVFSTHDGTIESAKEDYKGRSGAFIRIQTTNGMYRSVYMHLDKVMVSNGEKITKGQQIGTVGGSGYGKRNEFIAHLHYEIHEYKDGTYKSIDPEIRRGVLQSIKDLIDTKGLTIKKTQINIELLEKRKETHIKKILPQEMLIKKGFSIGEIEQYYKNNMEILDRINNELSKTKKLFNILKNQTQK